MTLLNDGPLNREAVDHDDVVVPDRPSWLIRASTHLMGGPILIAAAAAAALVCVAVRDPNDAGSYPLCPFRALTGWDCPGCGSMRAMHALTHLDLRTALDQNLLMVIAVPFLVWRWFTWTKRSYVHSRTGVPQPRRLASPWVLYGVLVAVLIFWLVRNLPGVPFLGSGIG